MIVRISSSLAMETEKLSASYIVAEHLLSVATLAAEFFFPERRKFTTLSASSPTEYACGHMGMVQTW